jgi:hypothetical protein
MHSAKGANVNLLIRVLFFAFIFLALIALAVLPVYASPVSAQDSGGGTAYAASSPHILGLEDIDRSCPYYAPQVAEVYDPDVQNRHEGMVERIPASMLPESLRPGGVEAEASQVSSGEASAAGTGGWMLFARPYAPSPDPNVSYNTGWFEIIDNGGRMHYTYERRARTDISRLPDAPGFRYEYLSDLYYTMYSEGTWSSPTDLTNLSGLWDSSIIYFNVDSDDYVHLVYTAWTWGRDPTRPAGEYNAYQHEEENLWYRYMSPDGTWSAPRQLTAYGGSWAILGADFALKNGRLHGTWTAILNYETTPSTYHAQVGFIEGAAGDWEAPMVLHAWDYSADPGQQQPVYWPSIDISKVDDQITMVNAVRTVPGALYTGRVDVYGYARDISGAWSGPENLSHAANNSDWLPIFVFYKWNSDTAIVMVFQSIEIADATHPPRDDVYLIYHSAGAWDAPINLSQVGTQQRATLAGIRFDDLWGIHVDYGIYTYAWTGAVWETTGNELKYSHEVPGGFSAPTTILGYQHQRYVGDADLRIDEDGYIHILFQIFKYDGASFSDYSLNYSTNRGTAGAFAPTEMIRPDTNYEIFSITLSVFADGDVLASWFEKGFNPGGDPVHGRMYSRYREGSAWNDPVIVSSVPGSGDILHVEVPSYPAHEIVEITDTGEQLCMFETAKYNAATHAYYDFRKYFADTVNGIWSTPELLSDLALSGNQPYLYIDDNQRVFVTFEAEDPATAKDVIYASMQRKPTPPATTYYFAEGTTRHGFEEWLCIQNPGSEDTTATITYMLESGENIVEYHPVDAHSRVTVNVNEAVGPEHDVSAKVEADSLIVAERPMYFLYQGVADGGHCVMGALGPSRLWYFAEGTTREGFVEYLTIQNPSDSDTLARITYLLDDGSTRQGEIGVGHRSRATVNVNDAVGPERDVSMVVESEGVAVVAERPMYFLYGGDRPGGHCVMGSTSLSDRWYFAEGTTRDGFDTYLCLQNPHEVNTEAQLTFILGDGSTLNRVMDLPATSRQTLRVNDAVGAGQDVSTIVRSESLILAERPMYFLYQGKWAGGHVETGALNPKNSWYFAEGTTRAGFEEWLTLENPGDIDSQATLSFMLEDGTVSDHVVEVPAHTRVTRYVPEFVGLERDVSVAIWSNRAIVAERPMYFLYHGIWAGGHDVKGL